MPNCSERDCKHGLSPYTNRITLIATTNPDGHTTVYRPDNFYPGRYKDVCFVGHNLKFDLIQLRHHIPGFKDAIDLETAFCADTMIMAHTHIRKVDIDYIMNYEAERTSRNKAGEKHRKAGGLSLKTLAPYFLNVAPFWETADHDNEEYVTKDTEYTRSLALYFLQHMSEDEFQFMQRRAIKWARMLLLAEERGVLIDGEKLVQMEHELAKKEANLRTQLDTLWLDGHQAYRAEAEREVRAKYANMKNQKVAAKNLPKALEKLPLGFDYDSPAQMRWYLRDFRGFNVTTFEGDESTGKGVLERLADEGHNDVRMFLDWRKTQKLLTAFLPTYKEYLQADEAVHPSFHLCGTRTGRLSCSDPNMQQLPKDVKQLFVPRPGYKFVTYDLAAIEAKLIAWFAEDPVLQNIIAEGVSLHDYNAQVFFGLQGDVNKVKEEYPLQRHAAKTVGFSLFYGAGANRVLETFAQKGFVLSKSQADTVLANFRRRFEASHKFHREVTRRFENFETVLNAVGRPIFVQAHESPYMQGFNTLVQSSASDLNLLIAERALESAKDLDVHLLLLVHDSISFEVKEDQAQNFIDNHLLPVYSSFKLETQYGVIPITAEGEIQERYQ